MYPSFQKHIPVIFCSNKKKLVSPYKKKASVLVVCSISIMCFWNATRQYKFMKTSPRKHSGKYRNSSKNNSKNRLKGTIELKSLVVTRDVMREYLLEKVIPAIHARWPDDDEIIFIQQDNARTHVKGDDLAFQSAIKESGLEIQLVQQPPNSPDTNALDLGFFSSIQSLTLLDAPNTLEELIQSVTLASLAPSRLSHFSTLLIL
jgi:hypothetical protein